MAIRWVVDLIGFLANGAQRICGLIGTMIDGLQQVMAGVDAGQIGNAVVQGLRQAMPILIDATMRFLGLGNIPAVLARGVDRVREQAQKPIDEILRYLGGLFNDYVSSRVERSGLGKSRPLALPFIWPVTSPDKTTKKEATLWVSASDLKPKIKLSPETDLETLLTRPNLPDCYKMVYKNEFAALKDSTQKLDALVPTNAKSGGQAGAKVDPSTVKQVRPLRDAVEAAERRLAEALDKCTPPLSQVVEGPTCAIGKCFTGETAVWLGNGECMPIAGTSRGSWLGRRVQSWRSWESGFAASQLVADTFIDPANWQVVWLVQEVDGNQLLAGLLRPLSWLAERQIERVGDWAELDMPEMGAAGSFQVVAIMACPTIESGPGRIVTAEFHHGRGKVYDLWVEGASKPIGVTLQHPFWSVDRKDWIPVGELKIGERLQANGHTVIVLRLEEAGEEPVFNLEVDADHCYRVGEQGILVHNSSPAATTFTSMGTDPVSVPWWSTMLSRPKGMTAVIVNGTPATAGFTSNFPDWWTAFVTANPPPTGSSWEKGHLLAKRFGGPATAENLTPQYFLVNQSAFKTCENRINDALPCGDVTLTIKVKYASPNDIIPQSFTFVATGNAININEVIMNVALPTVPSMCKQGASGGAK